ncbi:hypothetical protein BCR33DRAFT_59920 [Rhizoclosmatium globosum]|uniref:Homeodomain-like protein n=1 Tax=Rhizoclosmatium globosum TaxID=329046 RepID=A0A1Y2CMC9_9FUNG|nr:hypothetical protein BCR33DRAFT_59920 [Rhizoclosmatium globosum]|eukprot:ORY48170.1 hypothetical protein BCR33DRAFT_59920 [Rhizoclosmatium globosum]
MDCKIHWTVHMHPSINKSPFSKIEVESLERIVSQRVNQELDLDWDSIAQELGNDRLAWQCFRIYQKYINAASQSWTPEEDAKLTSLVATHGLGNWSRIARSMETRSRTQCIVRWRQNLRPGIARGRFTPEEDEKLVAAVQEFGERSWAKVANAVGTRNDVQCRERWLNVLNPDLRKGVSFTREENTQLLELVQVHGENGVKLRKHSEQGRRSNAKNSFRY